MKTLRLTENGIDNASEIILNGGLVAVPTETVYGLAANGLCQEAVSNIYSVKGRPKIKPVSLMVADESAMELCWESVPDSARVLARRFWPGPLTIVMTANSTVPDIVRAGGKTVGLRCPDHELTLSLLRSCAVPLAAPSANPSGCASPKTADGVLEYFDGLIDAVIDGGKCALGVESTVIDISEVPYKILREGAVSMSDIEKTLADSLVIFGITGGSGCGKTTALNVLKKAGALVIDCDAVYHDLTVSDADMKDELICRFGNVYNGNVLDRKTLGNVVFSDSAALSDLNDITHKYVSLEVERRLSNWAMCGGKYAAIDAIALLESGLAERCRAVVGIIAPTESRVDRLMAREGVSEEYARMRISAQRSNEYFAENCDFVLNNDGTIEQFEDRCSKLFGNLLKEDNNHGKRKTRFQK